MKLRSAPGGAPRAGSAEPVDVQDPCNAAEEGEEEEALTDDDMVHED